MRVAIVGGGSAGLLTSVLLARAGHEVLVLERDPLPDAASVEDAAAAAFRPTAPQIVQPHVLLPRFRLLLRETLPDVHRALVDAGVVESGLDAQMPPTVDDRTVGPDDDRFTLMLTRRSTLDWVLGRVARAEPGVTLHTRATVRGLHAEPGDPPRVTGLRVDGVAGTDRIDADVVVDASGRRSPVDRWLAGVGARPSTVAAAECGVAYYSRHYRLRTTEGLPGRADNRTVLPLDEITVGIWGADNGTVQLGICPLVEDARFRDVRDPATFTAVLRAVPPFDAWLDALEPITDVFPMAGLHNTLRRLVRDGRPVAGGLHAVGDSVCTTNPTLARGLGVALRNALDLVDVLAAHPDDPVEQVRAMDRLVVEHVEPYYVDQARLDAVRLAAVRAVVSGITTPACDAPSPPRRQPSAGPVDGRVSYAELAATAPFDAKAFRALATVKGMLDEPERVYTDPDVVAHTRSVLAGHGGPPALPRPDWSRVLAGDSPVGSRG